eukprot:m.202794 g.202794  ORF g.202794 m.202794 type:complete len:63 (-) comp53844_c0_seq1:461-649(-)
MPRVHAPPIGLSPAEPRSRRRVGSWFKPLTSQHLAQSGLLVHPDGSRSASVAVAPAEPFPDF